MAIRTFAATAAIALIAGFALPSTAAQAASTINGTFSAALFGITSSTFGIGAGSVLSNAGGFVTSSTADMSSVTIFTPINFSSVTATNGASVSFTSSFGSFIGTIQDLMTNPAPNAVVSFNGLGIFTPAGSISSFMEGPASLTVSFTQTGLLVAGKPQPAISGSFSFASDGNAGTGGTVPEPAAWVLLVVGFGLVGVTARRRRLAVGA